MEKASSAWERWVKGEELEPNAVAPVVLASWERCRDYGLNPLGAPEPVTLSSQELSRRRRERKPLLSAARRLMGRLHAALGSCPFLVAMADPDGFLLECLTDHWSRGAGERRPWGWAVGEDWSERIHGTNGIGTALSEGEPVFLRGEDHFFAQMRYWNCLGVPVRDGGGNLYGVLSIAGPAAEVSPTAHALAIAFAQELERELALCALARNLRTHNRRLTLFNDLERLLAGKGDCAALHRELVQRLGAMEPRRTVALLKRDPLSGEAFIKALSPLQRTVVPARWPLAGDNLVACGFRGRQAVVWSDDQVPVGWRFGHLRPRAVLAQPVAAGTRVFAVLLVAEPGPETFSDEDLRWYEAVARRLAAQLEKDRLHRELTVEDQVRRAILEQIDAGVVVIDLARGRLSWNQAMERFFAPEGGAVNQARGVPRPDRALKYPIRFFAGDMGQILERVVSSGETVTAEAVVLCDPPVTFRVTTGPVSMSDGRIDCLLQTYTDITPYRRLQQQKSELVAMISHELRTPLTGIKGYAQLLRQCLPRDESLQQLLGGLLRETDELSELVERVVAVNRLELDRRLSRRKVSLRLLLSEVVHRLEPERVRQGVKVEIEGPDLAVNGDPEALEQVFANLIENAIKFSPRGGLVAIRLGRGGSSVQVAVTDDGPGIPPEHHRAIFERFFRVPSPETVSVPGSGLGLYLVRRLVEQHGGKVKVDSGVGQGATFTVILPEEVDEHGETSDPGGG